MGTFLMNSYQCPWDRHTHAHTNFLQFQDMPQPGLALAWFKKSVGINLQTIEYNLHYIANDVKRKSHKWGLIIKKYIAMHTNYFLTFKTALYSSALERNILTIVESCFKPKLLL